MITLLPSSRRAVALVGAFLVAGSAFAMTSPGARAESGTVENAKLDWSINAESGGGAFYGGCNFLVAGKVGDMKSSHVWSKEDADAVYKTSDGDVSITSDQTDLNWSTKCKDKAGNPVTTKKDSSTHNATHYTNGTGTVDPAANTADITWKGSTTVVFYGGMTYWSFSDPHLVINADGTGSLKATFSGYGASMEDSTKWVKLDPVEATLANFKDAKVGADGFTATPIYQGVKVPDSEEAHSGQVTTNPGWGSFPIDFVNFQLKTGQSSYWYSSGGSVDARKPADPISFSWTQADTSTTPDPGTDQGEQVGDVDTSVTIPENSGSTDPTDPTDPGTPGDNGALKVTVAGTAADLGTAKATAEGFTASGNLPEVTVNDTRKTPTAVSVNGRASDFTGTAGTIPASALSWTPAITTAGMGAQAGSISSLEKSATLVGIPTAHEAGTVTAGGTLSLNAPKGTKAGAYKAKVTITTIG